MQTPTRPVACAYPSAAWPAPCSCRTSTCRTAVESNSGSYAGRIAPPGMPNTTSAPTASSEWTSDCAPVIGLVLSVIVAGPLRGSDGVVRPTKNPSCRRGTEGLRVDRIWSTR
jgi:hypothetical protein